MARLPDELIPKDLLDDEDLAKVDKYVEDMRETESDAVMAACGTCFTFQEAFLLGVSCGLSVGTAAWNIAMVEHFTIPDKHRELLDRFADSSKFIEPGWNDSQEAPDG